MGEIGTIDVNLDDLDIIIETNFSDAVVLLERWFCSENDKPDFFNYLSQLKGKASEWDKGRIFDDTSELRWKREKNSFHLLWIKDEGSIPVEWRIESLNLVDSRRILLWGARIDSKNEWYEKQIPRILEYPAKSSGSIVYVGLNEYLHADGSKFYRFKEVKAE